MTYLAQQTQHPTKRPKTLPRKRFGCWVGTQQPPNTFPLRIFVGFVLGRHPTPKARTPQGIGAFCWVLGLLGKGGPPSRSRSRRSWVGHESFFRRRGFQASVKRPSAWPVTREPA